MEIYYAILVLCQRSF